jgi:hypothetical protein
MDERQDPMDDNTGQDDLTMSPSPMNRRTGRRGFLGLLGRLGLGVVGGMAGVAATGEVASANPRPPCGSGLHQAACCCLVFPPGGCPGPPPNSSCPSGSSKRTWGCCSGGRFYQCIECTSGSNCKSGHFRCSEVWNTHRTC